MIHNKSASLMAYMNRHANEFKFVFWGINTEGKETHFIVLTHEENIKTRGTMPAAQQHSINAGLISFEL